MFSLLTTLIAIALVATLALVTLYYGGAAFNEGAEAAHAARIDAQSQQVMGAMELYKVEKGFYPVVLQDLVVDQYLKEVPTAQKVEALSTAYAAQTTWLMAASGEPVIVTKPVTVATCKAFNKLNLGVSGVLQQLHRMALRQCYGTDVNNLTILVAKSGVDMVNVSENPEAVVQIGPVLETPIPAATDVSANGWLDTAAPSPSLSFNMATVAFPDTAVNATAAPIKVTVTNSGTAPATLGANSATASAPFTVVSNGCASLTLATGASCDVFVSFSPIAAQAYSGAAYALNMSVAGRGTTSIPLTGKGISDTASAHLTFSLAPDSTPLTYIPFDVEAGGGTSRRIVTITNNTSVPLTLTNSIFFESAQVFGSDYSCESLAPLPPEGLAKSWFRFPPLTRLRLLRVLTPST